MACTQLQLFSMWECLRELESVTLDLVFVSTLYLVFRNQDMTVPLVEDSERKRVAVACLCLIAVTICTGAGNKDINNNNNNKNHVTYVTYPKVFPPLRIHKLHQHDPVPPFMAVYFYAALPQPMQLRGSNKQTVVRGEDRYTCCCYLLQSVDIRWIIISKLPRFVLQKIHITGAWVNKMMQWWERKVCQQRYEQPGLCYVIITQITWHKTRLLKSM